MVKVFDELKHLLEEGEEMLLSIFDNGNYNVVAYNKAYNLLFYFKAEKFRKDQKYQRVYEEIITPSSIREKLSHILAPKAIEILEQTIVDNRQYATWTSPNALRAKLRSVYRKRRRVFGFWTDDKRKFWLFFDKCG